MDARLLGNLAHFLASVVAAQALPLAVIKFVSDNAAPYAAAALCALDNGVCKWMKVDGAANNQSL